LSCGLQCGLGTLETVPPANSYPQNEPWIYDPVAPYGARYRRTGVYTNIMRNYHNTGLLTSFGDILVTGETLVGHSLPCVWQGCKHQGHVDWTAELAHRQVGRLASQSLTQAYCACTAAADGPTWSVCVCVASAACVEPAVQALANSCAWPCISVRASSTSVPCARLPAAEA